ncbi:cytosolic iron-sulfur assembly component 3 isoform X2 [Lutra lutra]|uniref:cytosolic iron-sulfur assembly component 3 isoform X2 n=1 Tax=Lutra lutra TaxID=9657 RepID=UPI001FD2861E|nr:cytosolic iron-sulfur assembly component 3 isoform X2 [Lutra lutra]
MPIRRRPQSAEAGCGFCLAPVQSVAGRKIPADSYRHCQEADCVLQENRGALRVRHHLLEELQSPREPAENLCSGSEDRPAPRRPCLCSRPPVQAGSAMRRRRTGASSSLTSAQRGPRSRSWAPWSRTSLPSSRICHVTVMPCYDKKLEASRPDFFSQVHQTRDVDCVVTTGEVFKLLEEEGVSLSELEPAPLDSLCNSASAQEPTSHRGGGSGGYLEHVFRHAARELFGIHVDEVTYRPLRSRSGWPMCPQGWEAGGSPACAPLRNKDFQEVTLEKEGRVLLHFAAAYGFRNIQNLVQKLKRGRCPYHYVEVMACPAGCLNGGGQLKAPGTAGKELLQHVQMLYDTVTTQVPEDAPGVQNCTSTCCRAGLRAKLAACCTRATAQWRRPALASASGGRLPNQYWTPTKLMS